jgi:1,4-alpha-glucan branching enzyme
MQIEDKNIKVDRGIALQKMIRLITLATSGNGYLNFMGNEFGHPEWIDFPREGNNWSYRYARRQWHLVDDNRLKYRHLARFDRDMIALTRRMRLLDESTPRLLYEHSSDKIIAFERARLLFIFNFHPHQSFFDYCFSAPAGKYCLIFDSDSPLYGGHGRLTPDQVHSTLDDKSDASNHHPLSLYLPSRTAQVLEFTAK